jgi:hypothetical protein
VGELCPANVRAYTVGASYKFGDLTAKASFANFKANSVPVSVDPALANSTNTSVNMYSGGVDYFALPYLDLNAGVYYQQDRVNPGGHSVMGAIGTQKHNADLIFHNDTHHTATNSRWSLIRRSRLCLQSAAYCLCTAGSTWNQPVPASLV